MSNAFNIGNVQINSATAKAFHVFKLEKTIEEKVKEKRQENGQEIEVLIPTKKKVPVTFRLVKPNRRVSEAAELYNAKLISEYVQMGIMPISLVAKRFGNDGGPLTEQERAYFEKLEAKARELNLEYYGLVKDTSPEATTRKSELINDIVKIQNDIQSLQNSYISLFENTAEMKAKKKMIDWWIITLAQEEKEGNGKKEFVTIFDGKTMDERFNLLNEYIESSDAYLREIANIFTFFIAAWTSASAELEDEDFKRLEEKYQEKFSEIKAAEEVEKSKRLDEEMMGEILTPTDTSIPPV